MHFKIIVPFYNVEKWIKVCIRSVMAQSYKDFQCLLIDDASSDNTTNVAEREIRNDDRFILIKNKSNVGALENIYNAIKKSNPNDEDVIVTLDGDDWFANKEVLSTLIKYYEEKQCWLTYGSHILYPSGRKSKFCEKPVPNKIIKNRSYRTSPWMTSALRTFKYNLWKNINIEDLKNKDGKFYEAAWDLAFMFPMLEMAGDKVEFVKEIVYVYNLHDNNDHVVPEKRQKQLSYEMDIRQKPKYQRIYGLSSKYDDRFVLDDASDLLTGLRFDLTAKTLYARHREKSVSNIFAKKVYEHHLDVWGGFTEKNPPKNNLEDFYESYHDVLDNIKSNGFDEEKSYIPVTSDNNLLNGSHRTAASIVYDKPVICKQSPVSEGQVVCSADYFLNKKDIVSTGLDRDIADAMCLEYMRLKKNVFVASLYSHSLPYIDKAYEIFRKHNISVVYHKDISLTKNGMLNYVISSYSEEEWLGNEANGYPGAIDQARLNFAKGSTVKVLLLECESLEQVDKAKNEIREVVGVGKPSMHATDTYEEAWRNATIVFHNPTLKYMNESKVGCFNRKKIKQFINETKNVIANSDLELEDFCVGGSAPLALYGIRDCRDFDLLHLKSRNIPFTANVGSHADYIKYYVDSAEEILYNPDKHIYVHGVKFISLSGMVKMKSTREEEKDIKDVEMSKGFLAPNFKNIVILAGGPPKPNRNRHLEIFKNKPLINNLIDECDIKNTKTYVVASSENTDLILHIEQNYPEVKVLNPKNDKIISTFEAALSVNGDCIMVAGDLINVKKFDLEKFIFSDFKSATCHYQQPWGSPIVSKTGNLLRRSDVGDCIMMISEDHKKEYLSKNNLARAKELFYHFYPTGNQYEDWNEYWYNDAGTFTSFAFFEKLWQSYDCNYLKKKGLISFRHRIYEDND
tara:strand:- start:5674 stop:8403 length:2730 start_codon:yes stop_codon:yes gene_type:complete